MPIATTSLLAFGGLVSDPYVPSPRICQAVAHLQNRGIMRTRKWWPFARIFIALSKNLCVRWFAYRQRNRRWRQRLGQGWGNRQYTCTWGQDVTILLPSICGWFCIKPTLDGLSCSWTIRSCSANRPPTPSRIAIKVQSTWRHEHFLSL